MTSEAVGLRDKVQGAIIWIIFERWGSRFLSLGILVILTRLLSPEDFGVVALASSIVLILQVVVDSGFSKSLVQRKNLGPDDAATAFWTSMGLAVALALLLVSFASGLASLFGEPELAPLLRVLSASLPLAALSQTPAALLERELNFRVLSVRQLVGASVGACFGAAVAVLGGGVWALVAQSLVTAAMSAIVLWASTSWRPQLRYSLESLRSLRSVAISMLLIDLLDAFQANIDKVLVGALFSAEQLGYYYLAQRMGTILVELVTSVISRVSFTTFSRVQDDPVRVRSVFSQFTFFACAVSTPMFALVAVLAPQIVPALFGDGWEEAVPLLWILAPGWLVASVMYFDRPVLLATGHSKTALGLSIFQNVLGLLLVFALLPLGLAGVALSRLARIVSWPIRVFVLRRKIGLHIPGYLRQILRCVVPVLPVVTLLVLLQISSWSNVSYSLLLFAVPAGLLGLICYAGGLWLTAGHENRRMLVAASARLVARSDRASA